MDITVLDQPCERILCLKSVVAYTFPMCGRYRLARKKEILAETFDVDNDVEWSPRYNVAPGQNVPVVRQDAARPSRSISLVRWGLIPFWAKDAKAGYKMINARAETVADTPAFRDPFRSRRCLIPADAFYEWVKEGKQKSPFCFSMADDSIFAFAGIWDRWRNPDKEWIETCSIITTSANALSVRNSRPNACHHEALKTTISGSIRALRRPMIFSTCSSHSPPTPCATIV